jgi:hypothetical protein
MAIRDFASELALCASHVKTLAVSCIMKGFCGKWL